MRHDPQRFMGKTIAMPYFNRDTVEFASRERDESNPEIKTLLPFLKKITEQSDLENFSRSHGGLRCLPGIVLLRNSLSLISQEIALGVCPSPLTPQPRHPSVNRPSGALPSDHS